MKLSSFTLGASLCLLLFIQTTHAKNKITMQGCVEAFFRMTCPDNDIISVNDLRVTEVDPGHPCEQHLPPTDVTVPHEMTQFCKAGNDTTAGHMCMYVENICDGKTECVFYVSPHFLNKAEVPTTNSQVEVDFECKAGPKRKGEIALAAIVAFVGIVSLFVIGGLLVWRLLTTDQTTYADFTNDSRHSHSSMPSSASGSNYGTHHGGAAAAVNDDAISVELRSPSAIGGNPRA